MTILMLVVMVGVLPATASAGQVLVDTSFEENSAGIGEWEVDSGWQQTLVGEVDPGSNVAWKKAGDTPNFADVSEAVEGEQVGFINADDVGRLIFADSGNTSGVFTTTAMMFLHSSALSGQHACLIGRNGPDGTSYAWKLSWAVRLYSVGSSGATLKAWNGSSLTTIKTGLSESVWYDIKVVADYGSKKYNVYYRTHGSGSYVRIANQFSFVPNGYGRDGWGGGNALQTLEFGSGGTLGGAMYDNIKVEVDRPKAFPTAEGYGAYAKGGRGGDVYHVTSLSGQYTSGTLPYGIHNASGPRTIVFDVSGTITLIGYLDITHDNLTIAGQTAPGDGICLKKYALRINADDVIVRHMRFRPGSGAMPSKNTDGVSILNGDNIILDHCSISWAVDENFSMGNSSTNCDATIQWCILSEGLCDPGDSGTNHSCGALFGPDSSKIIRVSMHHNLMAHNWKRNPVCAPYNNADVILDLRNNVIYNWGIRSINAAQYNNSSRDNVQMNLEKNYLIAGPDTTSYYAVRVENTSIQGDVAFYRSGNYIDTDKDGNVDGHTWYSSNIYGNYTALGSMLPTIPSTSTQSAVAAYSLVLDDAGAGVTYGERDSVDARIVDEVDDQDGGFIDQPSEVGGWPTLYSSSAPTDSDQDGMPNSWENSHGLNPNNAADRNYDADGDGYTNLEEYLNWKAGD